MRGPSQEEPVLCYEGHAPNRNFHRHALRSGSTEQRNVKVIVIEGIVLPLCSACCLLHTDLQFFFGSTEILLKKTGKRPDLCAIRGLYFFLLFQPAKR